VQLISVVIIGGTIAAAWRFFEESRSHRTAFREEERTLLRKTLVAYNEVKDVRRSLQSWGFKSSKDLADRQREEQPSEEQPSEEQIRALREEMKRFSMAQLSFESARYEVEHGGLFEKDNNRINLHLKSIADNLNYTLARWEQGPSITIASMRSISHVLDLLLGDAFDGEVVQEMNMAWELMLKHRLGTRRWWSGTAKKTNAATAQTPGAPPRR
jgi:hypothetical protein